jgi:C4-dicarboxylate transporter, DctM subunit
VITYANSFAIHINKTWARIFDKTIKNKGRSKMQKVALFGLHVHRVVIVLVIFLIYQIGGSVIDDLAFMILATPIFYPAMVKLGYHPLWAGIMIGLTVCVGSGHTTCCHVRICRKKYHQGAHKRYLRRMLPFLISLFVVIGLFFAFPQIVLWLPSVLMP